jgi:hypothetical protein
MAGGDARIIFLPFLYNADSGYYKPGMKEALI